MLATTAASLLLVAATEAGAGKATELDGDLIAACAEYVALNRAFCRSSSLSGDLDSRTPEHAAYARREQAMFDRMAALEERIAALPARTPEGVRAKAEAAFHAMADGGDAADGPANVDSWLPWSLLLDLTGRAGA
ncbi:hypothetical protein M0638_28055 [Roseomonas sp. NAR14]|uniref:Uncharacterized protein n=1 Tax=Roseomonas acroporae TaxID=2937791 RepID=A0A9X1YDK9_9PROT|nr:hypothetical protein [Roseomonas acroporae]MCK8788208.1 hypothetical protein [Roseomonas acroporae]